MANTIFEQTGGTYTQVGDYMLPDLLPAEEEKKANIGAWAMRHKRYLKQNHKVRYYNLLTSGKLNSYLVDIEQQAQDLFLRLVKELAEQENVTEELKSTDMMLWVQKMNNIRNQANEIVNASLIFDIPQLKTNRVCCFHKLGEIGRWGRLHMDYIMKANQTLYHNLLRKNMLIEYLTVIDKIAQCRYEEEERNYSLLGFDQSNLIAEEIVLQNIIYC